MHERRDNVLGTDVLGNFRLALECANLNFPTLETFEMALMRSFKLLLTQVCAPGYQGRKRGEVVRTRTVLLQAHTKQFLGTFGGPGNGDYRGELLRAIQALISYAKQMEIPPNSIVIRLDGLYGNAAPLSDVLTSGLGLIARSKDYQLLDLAQVQTVLAGPPDATCTHPESQ